MSLAAFAQPLGTGREHFLETLHGTMFRRTQSIKLEGYF